MVIESCQRGSHRVFTVPEELTVHTDLHDLKRMIQQYVGDGGLNIALAFAPTSYLYTKALSMLVQCADLVRKNGGTMSIVGANQDIRDILRTISIDSIVRLVPDMESLE